MIAVDIRRQDGVIIGYTVRGHAGAGVHGEDIVCAAVSSAAYMAANTVTEIVGAPATVVVEEGYMHITVTDKVPDCQSILSGFCLHIQALADQYPTRIHLTKSEV